MNRRAFLHTLLGSSVAGAVATSACGLGADTHDIQVNTLPLHVGLQRPLRLVALGDIHFDPVCNEAYLSRVVTAVNRLRADMIVYTGDFVTQNLRRVPDLADLLAPAQAPLGSFASPGNHEVWTNLAYVSDILDRRAGIHFLQNRSVPLPGEDNFYVTGLDSFCAGRPNPRIITESRPETRHLVLAHEPDSFLVLKDPRIKLQISGHTHGGQVRLPLIGPLVLPVMGHEFDQGLFARDDRRLYVNRGIGTLSLHLRINCRPEITVFELT